MEMIIYQLAYFFFLNFLFNFVILLLLDNNNVKDIFLFKNLYLFGKYLQIESKKNSVFFMFFDQFFSSDTTSMLIIMIAIGFNNLRH